MWALALNEISLKWQVLRWYLRIVPEIEKVDQTCLGLERLGWIY